MDIGVPYRALAQVEISRLQHALSALSEEEWFAKPIRRFALAGGPHAAAQSIVLRHEWDTRFSKKRFATLSESILDWCNRHGYAAKPMLPVMRETNSAVSVYTFPDWLKWQALVAPVIFQTIAALSDRPRGVLMRALFVRLAAGAEIPPHIDEQDVAKLSHRIHVPISNSPGCMYTIDGTQFAMTPGVIYDFNNCRTHGVFNSDDKPRINLMLEYMPNPDWIDPTPILFDRDDPSATLRPDLPVNLAKNDIE